jgi:hypothetical protein
MIHPSVRFPESKLGFTNPQGIGGGIVGIGVVVVGGSVVVNSVVVVVVVGGSLVVVVVGGSVVVVNKVVVVVVLVVIFTRMTVVFGIPKITPRVTPIMSNKRRRPKRYHQPTTTGRLRHSSSRLSLK